jgi:uncharacterized membrane protein
MLPDPLHPAVVHFPIVLMFLLPLAGLVAFWQIRRGANTLRAWAFPLSVAAALAASSWLAVETGESQGEQVEEAVAEAPLESHEERAEQFLGLSAGLVLLTAAGLVRGRAGTVLRLTAVAGALGLVAVGAQVGHSGGELVYRYGAASVHTATVGEVVRGEREDD